MVAKPAGHGSLIGATLGGYEVETLIGRGAMGSVYLAHDVKLKRPVALKVLLGSLARTPSVVKQFHLEAQAAAPLRHPGIVRVYSAGVEAGTPYIAMEFVDGEPLDRFLRRKGKIRWQRAFHIAGQMALALECAHESGVVHRDVKPSNIMLDRNGGVRLTDFGIANIHSDDPETAWDSSFVGTPQYMSPEQCTGGKVGPASDIFSLGVTLYQMISGELPFRGESSMGLIKSICTDDPPRLNKAVFGVPDDVARLVAFLMEKDLEKRPSSGRVIHSLIARLQKQKGGVSAVPEALTAFIKDEAEPRPFSGVHRKRPTPAIAARSSKGAPQKTGWSPVWGRAGRAAAFLCLALGVMAAWPLAGTLARERQAEKAPVVTLSSFEDVSRGVVLAQLFADGFAFRRLSWAGDNTVVLVEASGIRGTLTDGAVGLLAVDPGERRFMSLRPPSGPAMDPAYSAVTTGGLSYVTVPPTPAGTPLHDSILVYAREAGGAAVVLAQRWNEATPRPALLYRVAKEALPRAGAGPRPPARCVVRPDGRTVCLVLYDEATGTHYLAERDVRDVVLDRVGPRRTFSGGDIVPQSVQYSPDGSIIAFLRRAGEQNRELWIIPSGDTVRSDLGSHGRLLASDVAGAEVAFSPDGRRIAALMRGDGRGDPEIGILDAVQGRLEALLGPGLLSAESWHASGDYLIIVHDGKEAANAPRLSEAPRRQLWAVAVTPPHGRVQLTKLRQGLRGAYAVSRDGAWVAAVSGHDAVPSLFFVDLGVMGIGGRV